MRVRGIHYDIGTTTLDGSSTRPTLERGQIERSRNEIEIGTDVENGGPEVSIRLGECMIGIAALNFWVNSKV